MHKLNFSTSLVAIDALPFGIAICDYSLNIIALNKFLAERLGDNIKKFIGAPAGELFDSAGRLFFETIIVSRLLLSLPCVNFAILLSSPIEEAREVLLSIMPDETYEARRYILCMYQQSTSQYFERNLVEVRKALLDEIDRTTEESISRLRDLRDIAHDLRSPLNAISGMAEFAMAEPFGPIGDPRYRVYFRDIKSSADALNILSAATISLGSQGVIAPIRLGIFDPRRVLVRALRTLKSALRLRSQRLIINFFDGRSLAFGNDEALFRVLVNLVANASKFTPNGGKVIVRTMVDKDWFSIRIIDSGPGIHSDIVARLGGAFVPTRQSSDTKEQGSGLGLSIAARLVMAMRGRISIEESDETGTTICVTLARQKFGDP
ncbi:MAG: hypothetical protein C6Y20_10420 [Tagaea sp. CACIAM 22H2]|nr:hypothetical protein [Tagaea sp. CACIAM 22H2]